MGAFAFADVLRYKDLTYWYLLHYRSAFDLLLGSDGALRVL